MMQKPDDYSAAAVAMALTSWELSTLDTSGRSDDKSRRPVSHHYSEFSFCDKSYIFITVPQDGTNRSALKYITQPNQCSDSRKKIYALNDVKKAHVYA